MGAEYDYFVCIPLAAFNTAGMLGTYQALNGTGFSDDIKILKFYNGGTQNVTISYDNVSDHDFFPSGSTQIIDLQANHMSNSSYGSGRKNGRKGQIIYGKGTAGTGNFYIIGYR